MLSMMGGGGIAFGDGMGWDGMVWFGIWKIGFWFGWLLVGWSVGLLKGRKEGNGVRAGKGEVCQKKKGYLISPGFFYINLTGFLMVCGTFKRMDQDLRVHKSKHKRL